MPQYGVQPCTTLDRPLQFSQTDKFGTPYDAGMPPDFAESMPDQCHFSARTPTPSAQVRFVAVAALGRVGAMPDVSAQVRDGVVSAKIKTARGQGTVEVPLAPEGVAPGTATWEGVNGERNVIAR